MDKPAWIERILSDTGSYQSLLDYIDTTETGMLQEMQQAIVKNDLEAARVFAGELEAWKKLRHQLKMYEREEEQDAIIQEQRSG